MAKASLSLIDAIRKTAKTLEQSKEYQWGHMGSCNCGFLAQQVTQLRKDEIHRRAMERYGDWSEQLNDYCPTSGLPLDDVISEMIAFGFDAQDLKHLEKLSDPAILRSFPLGQRDLKHNLKKDVVAYMLAWANLLEQELLNKIELPVLQETSKVEA
ncbi:MAG: hypothetical protein KF846_04055 [Cyclobacteriaceae bacterium]|nr:hypothetical protein [Cyclobacteriaceae bacterium]MBX2955303.1 hypothetical protein [Cyclobacteriaceae bacterium]